MAENENAAAQAAETEEAAQEQTDYKALYEQSLKESRKWEDRSKRNLEELKALKESAGKPFWRSVDLTGNQTRTATSSLRRRFWRSVDRTGNQT